MLKRPFISWRKTRVVLRSIVKDEYCFFFAGETVKSNSNSDMLKIMSITFHTLVEINWIKVYVASHRCCFNLDYCSVWFIEFAQHTYHVNVLLVWIKGVELR